MSQPELHAERECLAAGVESLRELLESRGFEYSPSVEDVSSGGRFATGHFRRADIEIGLIVRNGSELGCPNYSVGRGFAGHADLAWALGREGEEQLILSEGLEFVARGGGDAFAAFRSDLEQVILPALERSEPEFREAVRVAVGRHHQRLGF